MIRPAELRDLDALVAIENRCFDSDRLSRRSFRHMLTRGNAAMLVYEQEEGRVCGYILLLFHAGTLLARLYSIAVDPSCRREGIGNALMEAGEQAALDHGCAYVRLEVRPDNSGSIALYRRRGYRQFGMYSDYYEDHADALRFEKALTVVKPELANVPYYRQTLDFTCGPASLMMAMKALDPDLALDRSLELRLWREATTIYMTSGHGGCGPYGMALAAWHRGFDVDLFVNDDAALFVDSVRSEEKKAVIRLVQEDFLREIAGTGIRIHYGPLAADDMKARFDAGGGIPVVLISSYRIYQEKFPHWVVVSGFDEHFIYVHDPFVDEEKRKSEMDCINMPILHSEFEHMARYGKSGMRAALVIARRDH